MSEMSKKSAISSGGVFKSLFWKFAERCGVQLSSFIVSVVLARILDPEDYGVLSMLLVFTTIAQVFVQGGLGTALIQKEKVSAQEYSGVFYISFLMAAVIYVLLYIFSPTLAEFFDMPQIASTLRIIAIILFFGALSSVLNAMFVKKMQFSKLFICNLAGSVLSGAVGIAMAYMGYGVWALVFQQLLNQALACIFMEISLRWRPTGPSSVKKVGGLIKYGYKIMVANLISTGYNELRSLVIGKKFDEAVLAFYDKGKQIPNLVITNLNNTIDTVMLPVYSSAQNDAERMKQMLRRSMKMSSFFIFPVLVGLCIVAKPLVSVVLTDKWLPCVPFLIVNSLIYGFAPLQTANAQVINAMGRSDVFLKLEIIKKSLGIGILAITVFCFDEVIHIAYGGLVIAVLSSLINMYPNTKLLKYSYWEQFKDILPAIVLSAIMGVCAWAVSLVVSGNNFVLLISQAFVGAVVYLILAHITKNDSYMYVLNMVKQTIKKKKQ